LSAAGAGLELLADKNVKKVGLELLEDNESGRSITGGDITPDIAG